MKKPWRSAVAILLFAWTATAGPYTRPGSCRPGDIEIDEDCSVRETAEAVCENVRDERFAAADVTLAAPTAAWALGHCKCQSTSGRQAPGFRSGDNPRVDRQSDPPVGSGEIPSLGSVAILLTAPP